MYNQSKQICQYEIHVIAYLYAKDFSHLLKVNLDNFNLRNGEYHSQQDLKRN